MLREAVAPETGSPLANGQRVAFDLFFEKACDAIFIIDRARERIVDANPKACQIFGYERTEIRRTPISVIHPDDMEHFLEFADNARRFGRGLHDELCCRTRSGIRVPVEMSASAIDLDDESYLFVIARALGTGRETDGRQRTAIDRLAKHRDELRWERDYLREEVRERLHFAGIIGSSPALMRVLSRVEAVARTDANVLVLGESGVGKELVARAIHERSARSDQSLVKVNCPSVPHELFESEFFGHAKGAFTGAYRERVGRCELADRGTLFLDEVGEIPLDLQAKLLQLLQDRQFCRVGEDRTRSVDVRVIAATNRNLLQEVRQHRFREDLYYRLSVFPIEVPPVRARRGDIPLLVDHFVRKLSNELGRPAPPVVKADVTRLREYDWPGNVREIQNVIERALIVARGGDLRLTVALSPQADADADPEVAVASALREHRCLKEDEMRRLQRANIIAALRIAKWQISGTGAAADLLGINASTLAGRMKSLDIKKPGPDAR